MVYRTILPLSLLGPWVYLQPWVVVLAWSASLEFAMQLGACSQYTHSLFQESQTLSHNFRLPAW